MFQLMFYTFQQGWRCASEGNLFATLSDAIAAKQGYIDGDISPSSLRIDEVVEGVDNLHQYEVYEE